MKIGIISIIDSEDNIQEWKEYHDKLGVTDYIFISDTLKEYPSIEDIVGYTYDNPNKIQDLYEMLLAIYRDEYDYLILLNPGEYIEITDNKTLPEVLNGDSCVIFPSDLNDYKLNCFRSIIDCSKVHKLVNTYIVLDGEFFPEKLKLVYKNT